MARLSLDKVLDRAQTVAREVLVPSAAAVDRDGRWPEEGLRALLDAELGGLVVPEVHDGLGHGLPALARVTEVLGGACTSTALCFGMHCVASAVISAKASSGQAQRYLLPIARGQHITSLALSEAGTGSHFWIPQTAMARAEDGFLVTGNKTFVTSGGHADSYVVSVVAAGDLAPPGQFSCLVIPSDAVGVEWGARWSGIGMRGNSSRTMVLRDVPVAPHGLLGEEGDQIWYVFNVIAPYFLVAMAGTYLGLADAALKDSRAHLLERRYEHDGSRLSQQPVIQHRLGAMWAVVERTRQLLLHAANEAEAGGGDAILALCSAKAEVADSANTVVGEAMTLMGGVGYREGGAFDRRLRDARAAHVMSPTTDILRTWAGRILLGENLLGY